MRDKLIDPPQEPPARPKREAARKAAPEPPPAGLPDAEVFSLGPTPPRPMAAPRPDLVTTAVDATCRNTIFEQLVTSERDVAGFVAYGLYKQSKRDWFIAFEKEHKRPPNAVEVRSYIVGESTERRLATYRHLAEETLSAHPTESVRPQLPASLAAAQPTETLPLALKTRQFVEHRTEQRRGGLSAFVAYVFLLAVIVAGMAWVLRSGILPFGLGRW